MAEIRSNDWMLTVSAEDCDEEALRTALASYRWCGQLEQGKGTGYKHWQVFIMNKTQIRFSTLKRKLPTAHLEVRRGSQQQCLEYVVKSETRIGEPIGNIDEIKECASSVAGQGARSDLQRIADEVLLKGTPVRELIMNRVASSPQGIRYAELAHKALMETKYGTENRLGIEVNYLCGGPGVGKTRMIHENYPANSIYEVSSYKNPFDGYTDESVLVLDEFRSQLEITLMLKLLDVYPFRMPARYYDKIAAYTTVWVVSNEPIEAQYLEVQEQIPLTWAAFLRRFDAVYEMKPGGVLVPQEMKGLKGDYVAPARNEETGEFVPAT